MEAGDSFFMEQYASQPRPYVLVLIVDSLPLPHPPLMAQNFFFFCNWSVPSSSTFYLSKAYKYADPGDISSATDWTVQAATRMGVHSRRHGWGTITKSMAIVLEDYQKRRDVQTIYEKRHKRGLGTWLID